MTMQQQVNEMVEAIAKRVSAELEAKEGQGAPNAKGGVAKSQSSSRPAAQRSETSKYRRGHQARGQSAELDTGLASMIDHTLLLPDATQAQLTALCKEADEHSFATVCVNATNIKFCAEQLRGSSVKPIAVVGFPLGAMTPTAKAFEAREAVRNGAEEIDMVVNVGALKNQDYALVLNDISAVVAASGNKPVKVILETASLNHEEKVIVCSLSKIAGAAFVKTSTGFGSGGATVDDIKLMRAIVGPEMGVKASGGIRSREDADKMIAAGADRIGASSSVSIVSSADGGKSQTQGNRRGASKGGY